MAARLLPYCPGGKTLIKLRIALWLLLVVTACNCSSGVTSVAPGDGKPGDTAPASVLPIDPREPVLAASIRSILEKEHLLRHAVDDEISTKAFARYLKMVDPDKMFLLAGDVAELERFTTEIDDELESGRFELAHSGAALFAKRLTRIEQIVSRRLGEPFDFSVDESFETDPKKRTYGKTEDELAERWRKALKFEVLQRVVRMEDTAEALAKAAAEEKKNPPDAGVAAAKPPDIPKTAKAREVKARADLAKSYAGRFARLAAVEPLDPVEPYLNAILSVYDPHTAYLKPAT